MPATSQPRTFRSPAALRTWLAQNHETANELIVRCFKQHASARGVTYAQVVDELLCFGWIDGVRRVLDDQSFTVRVSPRKPRSVWSAVNIARARVLEQGGRMRTPGLAAFAARVERSAVRHAHEANALELAPAHAKQLNANRKAARYFAAQPPWYQRTSVLWVMSAKQEATQLRRLAVLIDCCERGTTIPPLTKAKGESRTGGR